MAVIAEVVQPGEVNPQLGDSLWPNLRLLALPILLVLVPVVTGVQLPPWALYGLAGVIGALIVVRAIRDPELLVACLLLYLPLSRIYLLPIAPGINGTNLLLLLLIPLWIYSTRRDGRPLVPKLAGRRLVFLYALVTTFSVLPAILTIGAGDFFERSLEPFKSWIEQMLVFFMVLGIIRDGASARRIAVYAMIASVVSLLFGVQEMLEKADVSSIEASRVLGPLFQPNEYGAQVATNLCPFIALFVFSFPKIRSLWFVPFIAVGVKVLLATFSRGGVLGMGACFAAIALLRGKRFLLGAAVLLIAAILIFPNLLPQSLSDRFSETTEVSADSSEQLDKSSADRLILWQAGLVMISESPILGKGFGMFPILKSEYTAVPVPVADTHNMYLWIATQMGLPALLLFLLICARMAFLGIEVARRGTDLFARSLGAAVAAMVAGWTVINMFGSRMQGIETCVMFWAYLAIICHLQAEAKQAREPMNPPAAQGR